MAAHARLLGREEARACERNRMVSNANMLHKKGRPIMNRRMNGTWIPSVRISVINQASGRLTHGSPDHATNVNNVAMERRTKDSSLHFVQRYTLRSNVCQPM